MSTPSYVYVASSWRNPDQPAIVDAIRAAGIGVYDFRNPEGGTGFAWSEIDPAWQTWTAREYVAALEHPRAVEGYHSDFAAMQRADTFVLVLPCGRSAHLELGWAVGAGKRTVILTRDGEEPELMAKMVDHIAVDHDDLMTWLTGRPPVTGRGLPARSQTGSPGDLEAETYIPLAQPKPTRSEAILEEVAGQLGKLRAARAALGLTVTDAGQEPERPIHDPRCERAAVPHDVCTWRERGCVEAWPGCADGNYNPSCCRWPKSCSVDDVPLPESEDDGGEA